MQQTLVKMKQKIVSKLNVAHVMRREISRCVKNKQHCDAVIFCNKQTSGSDSFRAHRLVLASASPLLCAILKSQPPQQETQIIFDAPLQVVAKLVQFMYGQPIEYNYNNVEDRCLHEEILSWLKTLQIDNYSQDFSWESPTPDNSHYAGELILPSIDIASGGSDDAPTSKSNTVVYQMNCTKVDGEKQHIGVGKPVNSTGETVAPNLDQPSPSLSNPGAKVLEGVSNKGVDNSSSSSSTCTNDGTSGIGSSRSNSMGDSSSSSASDGTSSDDGGTSRCRRSSSSSIDSSSVSRTSGNKDNMGKSSINCNVCKRNNVTLSDKETYSDHLEAHLQSMNDLVKQIRAQQELPDNICCPGCEKYIGTLLSTCHGASRRKEIEKHLKRCSWNIVSERNGVKSRCNKVCPSTEDTTSNNTSGTMQ